MISVDGTYLNGNYGDILLSVVALDANNEVFPIAFAVVSVEYKANWSYFLWNLYHIVKDSSKSDWTIISYRQKVCFIFLSFISLLLVFYDFYIFVPCVQGIDLALEDVWPSAKEDIIAGTWVETTRNNSQTYYIPCFGESTIPLLNSLLERHWSG